MVKGKFGKTWKNSHNIMTMVVGMYTLEGCLTCSMCEWVLYIYFCLILVYIDKQNKYCFLQVMDIAESIKNLLKIVGSTNCKIHDKIDAYLTLFT